MDRPTIIDTIGRNYLKTNIENSEFSYPKAFKSKGLNFDNYKITNSKGRVFENLDLRFVDISNQIAVLIETKQNFNKDKEAQKQLSAYVNYEKTLSNYDVIAILANTADDRIRVWKSSVDESNFLKDEKKLKSFDEYINILKPKTTNDKEQVMKNTYELNNILHAAGIDEHLRSQFVGTCLLALKNNLKYEGLSTAQILAGIKGILENMLQNNLYKAEKLAVLDRKVLEDQYVSSLKDEELIRILDFIKDKILCFINDKSVMGQDLLNLFFTTFNKYVGKRDKNQAFTPDHIVDFMCKVIGISRNDHVLDPCCGSGAFLVRALTSALADCRNKQEENEVKEHHIFGIEADKDAFGLATTNMLIHGDGNSNVICDSCFNRFKWIEKAGITKVLMNPPYNAQKKVCYPEYVNEWKPGVKEDPSKGFHYVYEIAKVVRNGKLAVLLPMQCAIGTGSDIQKYKELMLQDNHLDAVFSLPPDIFHPGANENACCMIFDLGISHDNAPIKNTFFGYFKDDGFVKKKNLGRVEKINPSTGEGVWKNIENIWLNAYRNRQEIKGLSTVRKVSFEDEWLCEAYMETDYSTLSPKNFEQTVRDYYAFRISTNKNG